MNIFIIIMICIISYGMACFTTYLAFKRPSKTGLAIKVLFTTFVVEFVTLNYFLI